MLKVHFTLKKTHAITAATVKLFIVWYITMVYVSCVCILECFNLTIYMEMMRATLVYGSGHNIKI